MPPDYCPNCGAAVPARAPACPECGADEDTGWNDDAYAQDLGLPDEDFDYDEFVERALQLVRAYRLGDPLVESTTVGPLALLDCAPLGTTSQVLSRPRRSASSPLRWGRS